jgi:hypothetical protein
MNVRNASKAWEVSDVFKDTDLRLFLGVGFRSKAPSGVVIEPFCSIGFWPMAYAGTSIRATLFGIRLGWVRRIERIPVTQWAQ